MSKGKGVSKNTQVQQGGCNPCKVASNGRSPSAGKLGSVLGKPNAQTRQSEPKRPKTVASVTLPKAEKRTKGVSGKTHTQQQLDNRANTLNPNNPAYKARMDNRANQLNPNNEKYWASRGLKKPSGNE